MWWDDSKHAGKLLAYNPSVNYGKEGNEYHDTPPRKGPPSVG